MTIKPVNHVIEEFPPPLIWVSTLQAITEPRLDQIGSFFSERPLYTTVGVVEGIDL